MVHRHRRRRHKKSQAFETSSWRPLDNMDNRDANLGRSRSMPSLTPQNTEKVCVDKWERAYKSGNSSQHSPTHPEHHFTTPKTQAPDIAQFSNTVTPIKASHYQRMDDGNEKMLITNAGTKHQCTVQNVESSSLLTTNSPTLSDSEATIVPDQDDDDEREGYIPIALDASLVHHVAFRFPAPSPQAAMHYPPSPWESSAFSNRSMTQQGAPFAASNSATQLPEYTLPINIKGMHSEDGMCSGPWWNPSALYTPTIADRARRAQVSYGPDPASHHRRNSSRLSSLPAIPSPLGHGHFRKDFPRSDGSGLVPPSPFSPTLKGVHRSLEAGVSRSNPELSPNDLSAEGRGITIGRRKAFGHWRKETDPFVDYEDHQDQSSGSTLDVIRPPKHLRSESPLPALPPTIPSFDSFIPPSRRAQPLSIPPPPLHSISSKLKRSLQARPNPDAQKAIRENWIRSEAKKLVGLHQQMVVAFRKYKETKSREDYNAWEAALTALKDATDRQKRVEERRNLFLSKDSTALQTESENDIDEDATALPTDKGIGFSDEGTLLIPQEEDDMVKLKMGELEPVSGAVKQFNNEADDCEITQEMLATLNYDEKKALREHLLARLERGYSLE